MQAQASRSDHARPGSLSRIAVILYLLDIILTLALPATLKLTEFLYRQMFSTLPLSQRAVMVMNWMQALAPVVVWLWWLWMLLILATNCIFVAWLYRAYKELVERGMCTQYQPHWAITGFLVPVLNFVRPYQVVRDAWRGATGIQLQEKVSVTPAPLRIKLWWALTLIVFVMNFMAGNAMAPGLRQLTPMALAAYIGNAAVLAFSIMVIALIEGELDRLRSCGPARAKLYRHWLLPAVPSVSVVLATALITLSFYGYAKNKMEAPPPSLVATLLNAPPPPEAPLPAIVQQTNPPGVLGGVPGDVSENSTGGVGNTARPPRVNARRVRVSGPVQAGLLVKKIPPVYPPLARQARVSGKVTLHAIISKDGRVIHLEVTSGHPLLQQAALDAVRQWEYKPYLLNGEPVEVDTTVEVVFSLDQK